LTRGALITGASRGIGAAIATTLASQGHHVVINYLANEDAAAGVLHTIHESGGTGELLQFDVRDPEAVSASLESLLGKELSIDVLVNNAGVSADGAFPTIKPSQWDDVIRTTLDGFYNVTRPLVMPMVRRRFGRIINISSLSGLVGNRGQVNYSAAKAGLIGATRSLAKELAKRKITVNAIAPGLVETDMISELPVDKLLQHIPMQRLGTPQEVADLVAFLASDRAGYITGQVIGIDGGLG
jgi:3-oxoacyl-[acyl-carrier protein] reductase